jgi:hypothetical protein
MAVVLRRQRALEQLDAILEATEIGTQWRR